MEIFFPEVITKHVAIVNLCIVNIIVSKSGCRSFLHPNSCYLFCSVIFTPSNIFFFYRVFFKANAR